MARSALPTGTLTFLFTDIEGSSRGWERDPAEMSETLLRHNTVLTDAIGRRGGYVFKTVGDEFCAAFDTPVDALRAAIEAQRDMPPPIRVRMALHSGTAVEREGDYYGPTLNRVARLMGLGYGGQILLSRVTAQLLQREIDENIRLLDLGTHRLRDLGEPEHVFQVSTTDLPSEFPPLKSLGSGANNLPAQLTSFIGRQDELRALNDALQSTRLLTLTGPGGIGKTRLALEAAALVLDAFPSGVWFVDLSTVRDGERIPESIASALSLPVQPDRTHWDVAIAFLRDKRVLLILDNCEHLIEDCARRVSEVLQAAAGVSMLATSREPLSVPGEQLWPVSSLSDSPAVRLFVERATLTSGRPSPSGSALDIVAEICRCLDGIPLAIELAASRTQSLTLEEILKRLNDRFKFLTSGDRTLSPRQRTLRSAVDWSFDLLSDEERAVFRRTAVFAGEFTLEASEVVCALGDVDSDQVFELLGNLVAKSFVVRLERGGSSHFRNLETLREYAHEKLVEIGEIEPARRKHFDFYLEYTERWGQTFSSAQAEALQSIEAQYENIRGALAWGFDEQLEYEPLLRAAVALSRYWEVRGLVQEGRLWFTRLLERAPRDAVSPVIAAALSRAGNLANVQGDYSNAMTFGRESLKMQRQLNDEPGIAASLSDLGRTMHDAGRPKQASTLYSEALKLFRKQHNVSAEARTLGNLGLLALLRSDYELAIRNLDEALALIKGGTNTRLEAVMLAALAHVLFHAGRIPESLDYGARSLAVLKALGDLPRTVAVLNVMAEATIAANQLDAAQEYIAESLRLCEETGLQHELADAIDCVAVLSKNRTRFEDSALLIGAADAIRSEIRQALPPHEMLVRNQVVASIEAHLGADEFARLRLLGTKSDPKGLVKSALG